MIQVQIKPEVNNILTAAIDKAKTHMLKAGRYVGTLHHVYSDKSTPATFSAVAVPVNNFLRDDDTKALLVAYAHETGRFVMQKMDKHLECVFIIADSWLTMPKIIPGKELNYDNYTKPSLDPTRKEGLMVCICTKEGSEIRWSIYSRNRKDKIAFESNSNNISETAEGAGGTFSKLYPPELQTTT